MFRGKQKKLSRMLVAALLSSGSISYGATGTNINLGGEAVHTGPTHFDASSGLTGANFYKKELPIEGTELDKVYQSEGWGQNLSYKKEGLENGSYEVTLHFAEIYFSEAGKRVFNVAINGNEVLSNFDVFVEAGGNFKALEKTFTIDIADGTLEVNMTGIVNNAKLSGISIHKAHAENFELLINAGGSETNDHHSKTYLEDQYFLSGSIFKTTQQIANTEDDALFQSERWAKDLEYSIPLANGSYQVTLNFAEIYFNEAGKRVMDITANGQDVYKNFDIFSEAGGKNVAISKTFTIDVENGSLELALNGVVIGVWY